MYEGWAEQLRANRKILKPGGKLRGDLNLSQARHWDLLHKRAVAARLEQWAKQLRAGATRIIKQGQPAAWPRMLIARELQLN